MPPRCVKPRLPLDAVPEVSTCISKKGQKRVLLYRRNVSRKDILEQCALLLSLESIGLCNPKLTPNLNSIPVLQFQGPASLTETFSYRDFALCGAALPKEPHCFVYEIFEREKRENYENSENFKIRKDFRRQNKIQKKNGKDLREGGPLFTRLDGCCLVVLWREQCGL